MVRIHPQLESREKERNPGAQLGSFLCSVQDPNPQAGAAHIHSGEVSLSRSLLSTCVCSWWGWVLVEPGDQYQMSSSITSPTYFSGMFLLLKMELTDWLDP